MKLVNLTPHNVVIIDDAGDVGKVVARFPSEGEARVSVEMTPSQSLVVEGVEVDLTVGNTTIPATVPAVVNDVLVDVVRREFGEVVGLPDPHPDKMFIVSSIVMSACPGRDDLLAPDTSPDSAVRDDDGRIVGVKRLTRDAK